MRRNDVDGTMRDEFIPKLEDFGDDGIELTERQSQYDRPYSR